MPRAGYIYYKLRLAQQIICLRLPARSCILEALRFAIKAGDVAGGPALPALVAGACSAPSRPNGDTLDKNEILADLRRHSMRFTSFDVSDVLIRTKGPVGILTASVRNTAIRDGVEITTHARQLAIVSKDGDDRITISHFQSTNMADPG
jgi:hypothetical protein